MFCFKYVIGTVVCNKGSFFYVKKVLFNIKGRNTYKTYDEAQAKADSLNGKL